MGGGKIKDATALPSDVAKGKVFYNNSGRQVGTGTVLKMIEISVPNGTKGDVKTPNSYMKFRMYNTSMKVLEKNGSGNFLNYRCIKRIIPGKICFCEIETPSGNLIFGMHSDCLEGVFIGDVFGSNCFGCSYSVDTNAIYYKNEIEKTFPVTIKVFYK